MLEFTHSMVRHDLRWKKCTRLCIRVTACFKTGNGTGLVSPFTHPPVRHSCLDFWGEKDKFRLCMLLMCSLKNTDPSLLWNAVECSGKDWAREESMVIA